MIKEHVTISYFWFLVFVKNLPNEKYWNSSCIIQDEFQFLYDSEIIKSNNYLLFITLRVFTLRLTNWTTKWQVKYSYGKCNDPYLYLFLIYSDAEEEHIWVQIILLLFGTNSICTVLYLNRNCDFSGVFKHSCFCDNLLFSFLNEQTIISWCRT